MSGSIAGQTYNRTQECNCVRSRTKPVDKNTANQRAIRSCFSYLSTRWAQTLTDAQRTAWGVYGSTVHLKNRLLEDVHVSGFHHYLRSNIIRLQSDIPVVDDGPTVMTLPETDPDLEAVTDEYDQEMYITFNDALDWANEDGGYMILFQGRPMNHQRNFFAGTWRVTGKIEGNSITPPLIPNVQNCVFAVAENQNQFIYARISRADGRLSEKFYSDSFRGESYASRYDNFMVGSYRRYP